MGIKFEFFVNSDYTELNENKFEQKLEFKEINQEDKLKTELEEEFGFEIILFYALIVFVILLGVYKIYKNRQSV